MKTKIPVTNVEREIEDAAILVFRASLNGVITFADRDFIRISGFNEGDLYGKLHNVVRHPDMPQAVFMDMQETVASGKTWEGIIKNRCRNGDFYWAHATVSPVRAGRKITGYKSAYRKPTQPQIGEACRLYQQISEGKETVLCLSSLAGSPGKLSLFHNVSTNSRFIWAFAAASLILVCAGAAGLYEAAQQHYASMRNVFMGSIISGLLMAAWVGVLLARAMKHPLKKTIRPVAPAASNEQAGSNIVVAAENEADCLIKSRGNDDCGPAKLAGSGSCAKQQAMRQAVDSWKAPFGMKEQNPATGQNTGNTSKVEHLARNSSDISIKRARQVMGGANQTGNDAGKAVEEIVVAVKRVANIMAEISAVPAAQGTTGLSFGKPAEVAGKHEVLTSSKKATAKHKPLRAVKDEDDEWKDF